MEGHRKNEENRENGEKKENGDQENGENQRKSEPSTSNNAEDHITDEDRHKISRLSRQSVIYQHVQEQLKGKRNFLENIDNSLKELNIVGDNDDDDEDSSSNICLSCPITSKAQELLQKNRKKAIEEIAAIEEHAENIQAEMAELKTYLNRRYGDKIRFDDGEGDED